MIDSTLELITEAASNSLLIFCFCNMIILMILMGSKPGGSNFEQESEVHQPVPVQTSTWENVKQGRKSSMHSFDGSRRVIEVKEVSNVHEEAADDKEENSGSGSNSSISSNDHEEEDDELRRRVEEFIEKVNRGWKAELRRTSQLV